MRGPPEPPEWRAYRRRKMIKMLLYYLDAAIILWLIYIFTLLFFRTG